VLLRIIGDELAEHICRPFSHLRIPANHHVPDLTIEIWDEKRGRTGVKFRREKSRSGRRQPWLRQMVYSWASGCRTRIHAWTAVLRISWLQSPGTTGSLSTNARSHWHGCCWSGITARCSDRACRPGGLRQERGVVCREERIGKSTASLASICAGLGYLSEDYVGLQCLQDLTFVGHSIYNSVFMETSHMSRFTLWRPI